MYEAAERTITLLNNFLDLTRLDAGKVRPVLREVESPARSQRVLTGVAAGGRGQADRGCKLEAPAGPWPCDTDPVRLEQILVNLVEQRGSTQPARRAVIHSGLRVDARRSSSR